MTRFISRLASSIEPYVPGEQPKDKKYIKLNTNENPYPPSDHVISAIKDELYGDDLRLYPDPSALNARKAIVEYYNNTLDLKGKKEIAPENVFMGNGSDEILSLIMPAFFKGKTIAFADISYSFYPVITNLFEVNCKRIPLNDAFQIDYEDYMNRNLQGVDGILICNPNAPSGAALSFEHLDKIIRDNQDRLVIIDEAYVDFGADTTVRAVKSYDNLLVVQTLSKSRQLAGLRIGCAIGDIELINALNSVKDSFNSYPVDRLAIAACRAAFEDIEYFEDTRASIISTRERISKHLTEGGFYIVPSFTNFIFVRPPYIAAAADEGKNGAAFLFERLKEEGILVRYFNQPRISDMLRITIGTDAEMDALILAIRKIMSE